MTPSQLIVGLVEQVERLQGRVETLEHNLDTVSSRLGLLMGYVDRLNESARVVNEKLNRMGGNDDGHAWRDQLTGEPDRSTGEDGGETSSGGEADQAEA